MLDRQTVSAASQPAEPRPTTRARLLLRALRDWLFVAWVLYWSWAYIQTALAHRFPHVLGWARALW